MKVPFVQTIARVLIATAVPVGVARAQTPGVRPVPAAGNPPPTSADQLEALPGPVISRAALDSVADLSDADLDRYFLGGTLGEAKLRAVVPAQLEAGSTVPPCLELRMAPGGFRHYVLAGGKLYVDLPDLDRKQNENPHGVLLIADPETAKRVFEAIAAVAQGGPASAVRTEVRRIVGR